MPEIKVIYRVARNIVFFFVGAIIIVSGMICLIGDAFYSAYKESKKGAGNA
jgi:hypothetical protein